MNIPLDRFEALVQQSQIAVLIFADDTMTDFALVNAREFKLDPKFPRFLGVAGVLGDRTATALKEDLDFGAIQTIASAFASYVAGRVLVLADPLLATVRN